MTKARAKAAKARARTKRVSQTMRVAHRGTTVEFDGRRVLLSELVGEAAAWLDGLECYHLEDTDGRKVFRGTDGRFYAVEFVGVLVEARPARRASDGYLYNPEDPENPEEGDKGYVVAGEVRVE